MFSYYRMCSLTELSIENTGRDRILKRSIAKQAYYNSKEAYYNRKRDLHSTADSRIRRCMCLACCPQENRPITIVKEAFYNGERDLCCTHASKSQMHVSRMLPASIVRPCRPPHTQMHARRATDERNSSIHMYIYIHI